jgi:hypothetical protein
MTNETTRARGTARATTWVTRALLAAMAVAGLGAACLGAAGAKAQEASPEPTAIAGAEEAALDVAAEADILFELGVEAQRGGNYPSAVQYYLASQRLAPNKNVVFNIAVCFERLSRWADAFRYYDAYAREELSPEDRALVDDALRRVRPRVALLRVTSSPAGATVYQDRRDLGVRGRTPITLAVDAASPHRVILDLAGHQSAESAERTIAVGEEAAVELSLVRILGSVSVAGTPEGAEIRLDAADAPVAGTLPAVLELVPGEHVLYVSAPGHQTREEEVVVGPRALTSAHVELALETGSLVVDATRPARASPTRRSTWARYGAWRRSSPRRCRSRRACASRARASPATRAAGSSSPRCP